jgi:hypothetical protein
VPPSTRFGIAHAVWSPGGPQLGSPGCVVGMSSRSAFGHHRPVEQGWSLRCQAVEWVDADWPGWVRVRLVDADGRAWHLVDKVPVFGGDFGPETPLPVPVDVHCDVVGEDGDQLVIVEPRWDVSAEDGTSQFRVRRSDLEPTER